MHHFLNENANLREYSWKNLSLYSVHNNKFEMYLLLDQKNILIINSTQMTLSPATFPGNCQSLKTISLTQNISCLCSAFFLLNINQVCLKYWDFVKENCDMSHHNCGRCSALSSSVYYKKWNCTSHHLRTLKLVNKVLTQGVIQRFKDVNCNLSKLQTFLSNVAKNCRPWHFCAVRDCNLQSRTIKRFSKKSIPILSTRKL